MPEMVGFEPTKGYKPLPVFKTGAFNRSATSPDQFFEIETLSNFTLYAPVPDALRCTSSTLFPDSFYLLRPCSGLHRPFRASFTDAALFRFLSRQIGQPLFRTSMYTPLTSFGSACSFSNLFQTNLSATSPFRIDYCDLLTEREDT